MYQKLDIFVQLSSEITELELKKLTTSQATELLEQYKQAYIDHNAEKKAIILFNRRKHFMEKCSPNSFSKLYANYRFEKNDFDKQIKHGQEIGHKLAQHTNNNSNIIDNASNHITSISKHAYQEQTAILADKIVFSTTNIGQNDYDPITGAPLNKYDDFKTYIEVKDACEYSGGLFCSEKNTTTINGTNKDALLQSSIHEAIHAQAQLNKEHQLQNKKAHILPKNDMSEDFYTLLENNKNFYHIFTPPAIPKNNNINKTDYRNLLKSVHKEYDSYANQPLEKHAKIVAITAERSFRKECKQYSERIATDLAELIPHQPLIAKYIPDTGRIAIFYDTNTLDNKKITAENFKEQYLPDLSEQTKSKIIVKQMENVIAIVSPKDYSSRLDIEKCKKQRKEKKQTKELSPAQMAHMQKSH